MAVQIATEVRNENGALYLWEVMTSDVPGEGGARRTGGVTLVSLTTHELAVREKIAGLEAELATARADLTVTLDWKAQAEALTSGT
jgi:hypothetical protein